MTTFISFTGVGPVGPAGPGGEDTRFTPEVTQETIATSTTPSFEFLTSKEIKMTLTADVTSSSVSSSLIGRFSIILEQDGLGPWLFAYPSNVIGTPPMVNTTGASYLGLYYDGTNFFWS